MMLAAPLYRIATGRLSPGGAHGRLAILFYHRVLPESDPLLPDVFDARTFDAQLRVLADLFNVLPMDDAIDGLASGTLPKRALCITFDDGYRDNHDVVLPILRSHGLSATFYIASGFLDGGCMFNDRVLETVRRLPPGPLDLEWLGLGMRSVSDPRSRETLSEDIVRAIKYSTLEQREEACARLASLATEPLPPDLMMTSDQVLALHRAGMTIGGHTLDHPILSRLPEADARRQIERNRERLASLLGRAPRHFAYPNGRPDDDYTAVHAAMVREAGYSSAVSTARGSCSRDSDPFQLPRFAPWHAEPNRFVVSLLRNLMERSEQRAR